MWGAIISVYKLINESSFSCFLCVYRTLKFFADLKNNIKTIQTFPDNLLLEIVFCILCILYIALLLCKLRYYNCLEI